MDNRAKTVLITLFHAIFVAGLAIGFETLFVFFDQFVTQLSVSTGSFIERANNVYFTLLELDRFFLIGILLGASLLAYDVKIVSAWVYGFSFTKKNRCSSCNIKLIRKERESLDRFLSYLLPVHRYVCIGCGKEYLKPETKTQRRKKVVTGSASPALSPIETKD